ncbi:hypothetical protein [Mesorhizobium sp. B4-1-3]|uniref:hypothetical protein n=1 Tax=Mesorhizobium sp. B4-1-3 TaxID=2589889 RepID=UPI0015E38D53|nr:hypothetical protein [Mesorhizobium sp. B4-1-3]
MDFVEAMKARPEYSSACLQAGDEAGEHPARRVLRAGRQPSSPLSSGFDRSERPLEWPDLAEGRLRLDRL